MPDKLDIEKPVIPNLVEIYQPIFTTLLESLEHTKNLSAAGKENAFNILIKLTEKILTSSEFSSFLSAQTNTPNNELEDKATEFFTSDEGKTLLLSKLEELFSEDQSIMNQFSQADLSCLINMYNELNPDSENSLETNTGEPGDGGMSETSTAFADAQLTKALEELVTTQELI